MFSNFDFQLSNFLGELLAFDFHLPIPTDNLPANRICEGTGYGRVTGRDCDIDGEQAIPVLPSRFPPLSETCPSSWPLLRVTWSSVCLDKKSQGEGKGGKRERERERKKGEKEKERGTDGQARKGEK